MPTWISCTETNNKRPIEVNLDRVQSMQRNVSGSSTIVRFSYDDDLYVDETPSEIMQMKANFLKPPGA